MTRKYNSVKTGSVCQQLKTSFLFRFSVLFPLILLFSQLFPVIRNFDNNKKVWWSNIVFPLYLEWNWSRIWFWTSYSCTPFQVGTDPRHKSLNISQVFLLGGGRRINRYFLVSFAVLFPYLCQLFTFSRFFFLSFLVDISLIKNVYIHGVFIRIQLEKLYKWQKETERPSAISCGKNGSCPITDVK